MEIVENAVLFIQNFYAMAMVSPMEIYYSAFAMSLETSPIYMLYNQQIQSLPNVTLSVYLWTRSLCVFEGHHERVRSVVFSPDGKRIASASDDYMVQLWDAEKGEPIGAPLEGHHKSVLLVVFLPDGKRIASASSNNTVQLWDTEKGDSIGAPLEGHRKSVLSVVFSPDGKRITSASSDNTVWLWDTEKGELIVSSLSYSDISL